MNQLYVRLVIDKHSYALTFDINVTLLELQRVLHNYCSDEAVSICYCYDGDWTPVNDETEWHQVRKMFACRDRSVCCRDGKMMLTLHKKRQSLFEKRELPIMHLFIEKDESIPCRILPPRFAVKHEDPTDSVEESPECIETEKDPSFNEHFEQILESFAKMKLTNRRRH
jgi:hypothetical protein